MNILYKQPYWIKYKWDLSYHDDNQYVTPFNKEQNLELNNCFHQKKWTLNVFFKLIPNSFTDKIFCIIGKPGKNMGITFNTESESLAFEFWTKVPKKDDQFNWVGFYGITKSDLENLDLVLSVVRENNKILLYKNYDLINEQEFEGELIDDYKEEGIIIGAGNPGTFVEEHRYFGQFDIKHLSFIKNKTDINFALETFTTPVEKLLNKSHYNDILFLFDFKHKNNFNIILDESKNNNFMEKLPLEFLTN
jgi:hypothetical protein